MEVLDLLAAQTRSASCEPMRMFKLSTMHLRSIVIWRFMQFAGIACLAIVVLSHVAERFKMFPIMGWGLPDSPGHYLDLVSAIIGCASFSAGVIGYAIARRKN
jgi:hypothetical protein